MRAADTMKSCEPPSRWNQRARRHMSRDMRLRTRASTHRRAGSAARNSSSASTIERSRSSRGVAGDADPLVGEGVADDLPTGAEITEDLGTIDPTSSKNTSFR